MSHQKKCQRCEMEFTLDWGCCPKCGTKVQEDATRQYVDVKQVQRRSLDTRRDRIAGVIVISCLVVLGFIVLGIYLLGGTAGVDAAQSNTIPSKSRSFGNSGMYGYGPVVSYFVILFLAILFIVGLGRSESGKETTSDSVSGCFASMLTLHAFAGLIFFVLVVPVTPIIFIIFFIYTCCRPPI